jgi:hypothetical protein
MATQPIRLAWDVVRCVALFYGGGAFAWDLDASLWIRCGIAAIFFALGLPPLFRVLGALRGQSPIESFVLGYRAMTTGYLAAGVLLGIAALWQRSVFGFVTAYGAFSVAWFAFWARKRLFASIDIPDSNSVEKD